MVSAVDVASIYPMLSDPCAAIPPAEKIPVAPIRAPPWTVNKSPIVALSLAWKLPASRL